MLPSNICTEMLFQTKIAISHYKYKTNNADVQLRACTPDSFSASGETEKLLACHSPGKVQRSTQRQGRCHLEGPGSLLFLSQKECVPSSDVDVYISDIL